MPAEVASCTDYQLISQIKQNNNSAALTELVTRNTGIYVQVVNSYTYVPKVERDDLIDHRMVNIYNYALSYDPSKNMKVSSWIGKRIKWDCYKLIENEKEEINEQTLGSSQTYSADLNQFITSQVGEIEDKRFARIFELRHSLGKKKLSWKKIAGIVGDLSHEHCRGIYNRNVKFLKNRIKGETLK